MPFARPTLGELVTRIRSDFRAGLGIAGPLLRRAMADVAGAVWAGAVHMLHGHIEFLGLQLFPDKSEAEFLLRQASMYGITPTPATFAAGTVTATGTNGSPIAANTLLQVDGNEYRVTTLATIASGTAIVSVQAVLAGAAGNVAAGVTMTFESPVTGVNTATTVNGPDGIADGFNQESIEEVRDNLQLRLREPPEGGADQDYEAWALAVAGVTRAWVYPVENGLGTVVVRFVTDEDDGTVTLPASPLVAAVQAALSEQRPITAEVTAVAPTSLVVNFTIDLTPDTADIRAAVIAELTDLLRREAAPHAATGEPTGIIKLSHIRTAIGRAVEPGDYALTVPSADVVPALGQLAVLGTVTWL